MNVGSISTFSSFMRYSINL